MLKLSECLSSFLVHDFEREFFSSYPNRPRSSIAALVKSKAEPF
jgi:hypothetical protein